MNNCVNTTEVHHVHSFHAHSGLVDFHVTCLDFCLRQTWPSWPYSLCLSPSDLTQLTLQSIIMSVSIRPDPADPTVYNYVCLHQTWPCWPYSLSPSDLTQLTLQSIIMSVPIRPDPADPSLQLCPSPSDLTLLTPQSMSVSIRPDPADPTVYNYVCPHQTWPSWP